MSWGKRGLSMIPTEAEEQAAVIAWAQWTSTLPALRKTHACLALLHANMNAGKRTYASASWAQHQGMKSGVPDLMLPVARGGYHGLFIEMKRVKGGRLNAGQQWWGTMLREQGYMCLTVGGADRAIQLIEQYLKRGCGDAEDAGRQLSTGCGSAAQAVRPSGDGG